MKVAYTYDCDGMLELDFAEVRVAVGHNILHSYMHRNVSGIDSR